MIKSYRHLVDSLQFEIPSGYIEDNESPKDAAVREFQEKLVITLIRFYLLENIL